jgi:hypothetical protein
MLHWRPNSGAVFAAKSFHSSCLQLAICGLFLLDWGDSYGLP